jgi:hypothetical protein
MRPLVIIESPFAGATPALLAQNKEYLRLCILDSLNRGEAPFASHRMYTDALDDNVPEQRKLGMEAGRCWTNSADLVAVYTDLGMSPGMRAGVAFAKEAMIDIEERQLGQARIPPICQVCQQLTKPNQNIVFPTENTTHWICDAGHQTKLITKVSGQVEVEVRYVAPEVEGGGESATEAAGPVQAGA